MYAQKSDKWHFTMKRYMGLDPDTSFLFGILPGVCREAIGRYDWMYTDYSCFNSNKVYAWSEHHANKINDKSKKNMEILFILIIYHNPIINLYHYW